MVKCPTILSVDDSFSTTCLWSVMYNEVSVSAENYSDLELFKNMTEKKYWYLLMLLQTSWHCPRERR